MKSSDRTSRITRFGCHSIQRATSGLRRDVRCRKSDASRTLARAPANRLLPTINNRAGMPERSEPVCVRGAHDRRPGAPIACPNRLRSTQAASPPIPLALPLPAGPPCPWAGAARPLSPVAPTSPPSALLNGNAVRRCLPLNDGDQLGTPLVVPTRGAMIPGASKEGQSGWHENVTKRRPEAPFVTVTTSCRNVSV